jgi:type IV pilus assembly protein PilA
MKPLQKGEVLGKSLIAILAIAPAIAFAENADHAVRERVSQGLNIAGAAKTLVSDNVRKAAPDFSKGWTSQELSGLNAIVHSVKIDPDTGVITVNYTEQAKKIIISLTPSAGGTGLVAGTTPLEDISWHCAVSNPSVNKYVPDDCRM